MHAPDRSDSVHHPIDVKLYYAKSAVEGNQEIRYNFSHYFETVLKLLKGYEAASSGMIRLHVIDPEPYSQAEQEAIKLELKKYPVSQEKNFFFGLVVETRGGVNKTLPILSPGRQHLLEYDITALIDNAIMPEKKRIGILSSLPVLGDNVSGYMAEMMKRQGQTPKPAWTFVEQLRKEYQVEKVRTSVAEIGDIDLLLIICLVSQRNDDIYMAITSSFGDTTPVTKGSEVESLDALRTKEARLLAREQAVKFSEKHKGWLYRIPKDSGRHLIQRIASLIE